MSRLARLAALLLFAAAGTLSAQDGADARAEEFRAACRETPRRGHRHRPGRTACRPRRRATGPRAVRALTWSAPGKAKWGCTLPVLNRGRKKHAAHPGRFFG